MNIDMGDIKSFVTVAELKSITAAANKLNYLQSNMTAKIKKLKITINVNYLFGNLKVLSLPNLA